MGVQINQSQTLETRRKPRPRKRHARHNAGHGVFAGLQSNWWTVALDDTDLMSPFASPDENA
jgi:hypothetical protein